MEFLPWTTDEKFSDKITSALSSVDVLSLDIFDTALTRTVDSPSDVWAEVERRAGPGYEGFAVAREDAERKARKSARAHGREDVTFEEIVRHLPARYRRPHITDLELAIETEVLIPVPDIQALYTKAKADGKSVIFVSDMYHSSKFLSSLLERHGYRNPDHVYVSGELGMTKHVGTIWTIVKSRWGSSICHVGDNTWSDVFVPEMFGIKTMAYVRATSELRQGSQGPAVAPYSKLARQWALTSRNDVENLPSDAKRWFALGYRFLGPVLTGFTHWTADRARDLGIKRIYYLAREGSLLYRAMVAYGQHEPGTECRYLEVSRRTVGLAAGWFESTPGVLSPHLIQLLTHADHKTTARKLLQRCHLQDLKSLVADLEKHLDLDVPLKEQQDGEQTYKTAILRHRISVYGALREPAARTVAYLRQEGVLEARDDMCLIDSGWSGTIQRAIGVLRKHMGAEGHLTGLYYALWKTAQANLYVAGPMEGFFASGFEDPKDNAGLSLGVGVVEELHGADIGSTIDYLMNESRLWVPEYQKRHADEVAQFDNRIRPFQHGAIDYVLRARKDFSMLWSVEELRATLDTVLLSPSQEELNLLGSLNHAMTFDHSNHQTLAQPWPGSIEAANVHLEFADWHNGLILHWYRTADEKTKPHVRELARMRLTGYLNDRQMGVYGL